MNNEKKWLGAYLYYAEPWEKILVEAVKPFAEQIINQGHAEQYFFIRYWEKGPHIRLRFKGDANVLDNKVKPQLTEYFEAYFKSNSSVREEPNWPEDITEDRKWYPNNSIQFVEYEPEVGRYGGEHGIVIAEQQFQAASKAILAVTKESQDSWDYSRALGAGIQLHLGFGYALGMELDEMSAFFNRFFENWLSRAYYFFEKDIAQEELGKRKKETLEAFEQNFEEQKESLIPFFETVWQALNEGQEFEQEWLNKWVADMSQISNQLKEIQKKKILTPPEWYMQKKAANFTIEQQERWSIYDSYVHMINNRLGIQNRDEAYLGYLIIESIKVLENGVKD
jgi:thiopeptide-type bacteriocin biosynthesis protein